jgi:hypothetical protein
VGLAGETIKMGAFSSKLCPMEIVLEKKKKVMIK